MKLLKQFIQQETVLTAAAVLAVISAFFVPPDVQYLGYIDLRTLAILFSLMTVMAGLRRQGFFDGLGRALLSRTHSTFQLTLVLVGLCFFGSMFITNDVSLLTFVPFTFVVLSRLGADVRRSLLIPVVCMQTIAANLGSMLTPIGNPQNLYLYGKSGMSIGGFVLLMLPYTLVSLFLLLAWAAMVCRKASAALSVDELVSSASQGDQKIILLYLVLFAVCLLSVIRVLPYGIAFAAVLVCALFADPHTLRAVDYSLLLTFVAFFIFIGNLGRIPAFSGWLQEFLTGREVLVAVLASQVTSNVPAALLLSGFTAETQALIIGTNLGGLGTLIASMASLISYRQIARELPQGKKQYFGLFTLSNLIFLAILLGVPIGVLTAVFLAETAPEPLSKIVRPAIELLAGIPSVIYGLLGILLLCPAMYKLEQKIFAGSVTHQFTGGANLISAVLVLAIMILPTVINISESALRSVPASLKAASLGLGASRIQTIFRVTIPAAKSGIATAIVLGVGRAIGEAMAISLVSGSSVNAPLPFHSVRFLTTAIVAEMGYAADLHRQVLFTIGLVLFVFIMIINMTLNKILKGEKE